MDIYEAIQNWKIPVSTKSNNPFGFNKMTDPGVNYPANACSDAVAGGVRTEPKTTEAACSGAGAEDKQSWLDG